MAERINPPPPPIVPGDLSNDGRTFQQPPPPTRQEVDMEEARTKAALERLLDIPYPVTIAGVEYAYTSRPIGFLHMILNELAASGTAFTGLTKAFAALESGASEPEGVAATREAIDAAGEAAGDHLLRVSRILLEPLTADRVAPPNEGDWKLKLDVARWSLPSVTLATLLVQFYARDLVTAGGAVKNLIGLGRKT